MQPTPAFFISHTDACYQGASQSKYEQQHIHNQWRVNTGGHKPCTGNIDHVINCGKEKFGCVGMSLWASCGSYTLVPYLRQDCSGTRKLGFCSRKIRQVAV